MKNILNRWYVAAVIGLVISSLGLVLPHKLVGGVGLIVAAGVGAVAYLQREARTADTAGEETETSP